MARPVATPHPVAPAGHYRWVIIALLFVVTTINYMDRNLLAVLKPTIQGELHFNETEYGDIVFAFSMAYAAGYASMGAFTDRVGVRIGLAVAAIIWSAASTAHGLVTSVGGFIAARILLGLGEGGNFPTCIKSVATWFPVRDRALATGVFNSGSNIGGLLAPLIAAFVTTHWGWQTAFYFTGAVGFIWVVFWFVLYRPPEEHPKVSPAELAYIKSDPEIPIQKIPWIELLRYPGTWVYLVGAILTNPVWWFYNNWVPSFLFSKFNVNFMALGLPLVVIYLMTDVGSIGGGWLSGRFIRAGLGVFTARKLALLTCAACTVPVFMAPDTRLDLARRSSDRSCDGSASGTLGQSVHACVRYDAEGGGRRGGRSWRMHQFDLQRVLGDRRRPFPRRDPQQLHAAVLRRRWCVCGGDAGRAFPAPEAAERAHHVGAGR